MEDQVTEPDAPSLYEAVGRVAVEGAQLEASFTQLLANLGGPDRAEAASGQALGRLLDMTKAMTKDLARSSGLPAADLSALQAVVRRATHLKAMRDSIVHARWLPDQDSADDGAQIYGFKPVKKSPFRNVPVGLPRTAAIQEIAAQIHVLTVDVFEVGWNLTAGVSGMPRIDPLGGPVVTPHGGTKDGRGISFAEAKRREMLSTS
jgi:hypothetical protein